MFRRRPHSYALVLGGERGEELVWTGAALAWEDVGCERLLPTEIEAIF